MGGWMGGCKAVVSETVVVYMLEHVPTPGSVLGPTLQLFKDAWLLHMHPGPWAWQPLKVENEDHGAPELWCHPACRVSGEGQPAGSALS